MRHTLLAALFLFATVSPACAATYTDAANGFQFEYPASLKVETEGYESLHPFAVLPVAYISKNNEATQTSGYLTFNVSDQADDIADCLKPHIYTAYDDAMREIENSMEGYKQTDAKLDGIPFTRTDAHAPSPLNGMDRIYSTIHGGKCYKAHILVFAGACTSAYCRPHAKWSRKTERAMLKELDFIAVSLRFTK